MIPLRRLRQDTMRRGSLLLSPLPLLLAVVAFMLAPTISAFSLVGAMSHHSTTHLSSTTTDDLLKPDYEIAPLPIRIGHGFDIHRMAPLQEAGQPVVIGGVTIDHKDQKVKRVTFVEVCRMSIFVIFLTQTMIPLYSKTNLDKPDESSGPTKRENTSNLPVPFTKPNSGSSHILMVM